jgi:uncharacterized membrane-anchored protein YitT (DUF2179 family)
MINITPKMLRRTIKEYVFITFGLMAYAFGWVAIILPAHIVGGGVGGISLLIYYATGGDAGGGIPLAYSMLIINSFLLILATIIIGFKFSAKTLYAVLMMSLCMGVMQATIPPDLLGLGEDPFLSAILAGIIAGVGLSICFSQGGSTGGTDIIAMIINKYHSVSYGRVIMACDFIIIGLSYFIGSDIATVIYSYIVVAALGYTLDAVMAGNNQSSQILIMSHKYEEIAASINQTIHRGVTMLDGTGWYSKEPIKVVMVVCRKSESGTLFRVIKDIDPEAFITVGSVMGVYGKGFEAITKAVKSKKML